MTIKEWMQKCFDVAESKGWHDRPLQIENELMNFHAEISEAWEELRKGWGLDQVYFPSINKLKDINKIIGTAKDVISLAEEGYKPEGFAVEIADLLIRIFHTCKYHGIDIETYMELKTAYNKTRSYRHGGKTC